MWKRHRTRLILVIVAAGLLANFAAGLTLWDRTRGGPEYRCATWAERKGRLAGYTFKVSFIPPGFQCIELAIGGRRVASRSEWFWPWDYHHD